jgi:hypothetical protein
MGHDVLSLLARLTRPSGDDPAHRAFHAFYDNAQNVYGRTPPRWKEMGIDLVGRTTIMRESFRGSRLIAELALNVVDRLSDLTRDQDHLELIRDGSIEVVEGPRRYLRVHYNRQPGLRPSYQAFATRDAELRAVGARIRELVTRHQVEPRDICVLAMGRSGALMDDFFASLRNAVAGCDVAVERGSGALAARRSTRTLLVTTPHSFKGFDAEVVVAPGLDGYVYRGGEPAVAPLYVALTRARSMLLASATRGHGAAWTRLDGALSSALEDVLTWSTGDQKSDGDHRAELLDLVGSRHARWLGQLTRSIRLEGAAPELPDTLRPLAWFHHRGMRYAIFLPSDRPDALPPGWRAVLPGEVVHGVGTDPPRAV